MKWKLETRKISQLKDHPKNPRILTQKVQADLMQSIDKFGLIDKPIVNLDGTLIGGHQRKVILKKMGLKEVECWVPEVALTAKEVDELNIRLNKNTGDWDFEKLANEWEPTDLLDWGFTLDELVGQEVEEIESSEEETDNSLDVGKDEDALTKLGDLYELNEHRIICGDSTLPDIVAKVLNGAEPILMVTDPPYGVEYDPSWRDNAGKGCRAKGKVQNDDKVNWALAWHLFPGSVAYTWCASWFLDEVAISLKQCEFEIKSLIIWNKQHFALGRGDYHWKHEPCWYAIKKNHSHNWQGSRKECTVWDVSNLNCIGKSKEDGEDRTAHSTQKPIECMARPIRNNTAKGEGVYDPFLGSGTTLIAAQQLSRICYGVELSPAYVDIIIGRWVKYMQKNGKQFNIKKNGEEITWQKKREMDTSQN